MKQVFLRQAQLLLSSPGLPPEVHSAKAELDLVVGSLDNKTASAADIITDPRLANVLNLLTPFLVNYKINQVVKLIKEYQRDSQEQPKVDPSGRRRYV